MNAPPCPTCSGALEAASDSFFCRENHRYTRVGLALATNIAAVNALWLAIHALEDDAAGLEYMSTLAGREPLPTQLEQAASARGAARRLREYADEAQQRLDALPVAPSAVTEAGSQRGRGG